MRIFLVSSFLPDVTQHIHSLRASGVMSSHTASAVGFEMRAFRKSAGSSCTTPAVIIFLIIRLVYQKLPLAERVTLISALTTLSFPTRTNLCYGSYT
jgi:hypothetical protein